MKKDKSKYTILVLSLLNLVFIGYIVLKKPQVVSTTDTIIKTDTIIVNRPYKVPTPYKVEVPAQKVTIYEKISVKDQKALDSMKLIMQADSILIQGLKSELAIHVNYLKRFPQNPKLINLDLNRTNLSLSLLNTDGNIAVSNYPIELNRFRYRWSDNILTSKSDIFKQKSKMEYYFGGGLSTWYFSPFFTMKAEKGGEKSRIYLQAYLPIFNRRTANVNIGYEKKLFFKK